MNNVYFLEFSRFGNQTNGYLTAYEKNTGVPFEIKRVYTVTEAAPDVVRGYHAHKALEQIFIALGGEIEVFCEDLSGNKANYTIKPDGSALYCGPDVWHTLTYKSGSSLLVLASDKYDESDYIRDYSAFLERGV